MQISFFKKQYDGTMVYSFLCSLHLLTGNMTKFSERFRKLRRSISVMHAREDWLHSLTEEQEKKGGVAHAWHAWTFSRLAIVWPRRGLYDGMSFWCFMVVPVWSYFIPCYVCTWSPLDLDLSMITHWLFRDTVGQEMKGGNLEKANMENWGRASKEWKEGKGRSDAKY